MDLSNELMAESEHIALHVDRHHRLQLEWLRLMAKVPTNQRRNSSNTILPFNQYILPGANLLEHLYEREFPSIQEDSQRFCRSFPKYAVISQNTLSSVVRRLTC